MTSGWHVFSPGTGGCGLLCVFRYSFCGSSVVRQSVLFNMSPDKSQPPMDFDNSQCILTDIDLDRVFRCVSVAMHVALRFFSEVPKASGPISSAAVPKEVDAAVAWLSLQDV